MNRLAVLWQSSVGKKAVMAVTGLILVAYLITHVLANLLVFSGPERINRYAQLLHSNGAALWGARLILLCLLYTSPSPRDRQKSRMPSSA